MSKGSFTFLVGAIEKLFKTSSNQIETVNDFIFSISVDKKLTKLFYPIICNYITKTEYFPTNFVKNHKTSKYIKSAMFQNILNTYKITNIKLTNELSEFLNVMFNYICKKIIVAGLIIMENCFRKTLYSRDLRSAIYIIIPSSIGYPMIKNGTKSTVSIY